ncbi:MAG TPA: hydrogenase maturation protease [Acidimicrobiia bacterium]|nr:hydrogenase maturation protease [Acidimicrobiia bacterium]
MKTLVVGVGNPYRSDDAAGLEVARLVARAAQPGVDVLEHDGEPGGLLESWAGFQAAFVVDAVRSGGPPGKVERFDVTDSPLPDRPARDSSHSLSLGDAVELGRVMGRLPERLVVVGITGATFAAGGGLTPEVAAATRVVAEEILAEISGEGSRGCA